ncbi:MAG: hypothetical protein U0L49_00335 [Eubacterium sp.]|nr:hypothetical protein [Eubacterium sp.]
MDERFQLLDTKAFDRALSKKQSLINSYDSINNEYDRIVNDLLKNWKGRGADAFKKDATTVKTNLTGIFDILKIMCDTLTDAKTVFTECDTVIGDFNRNPDSGSDSGSGS